MGFVSLLGTTIDVFINIDMDAKLLWIIIGIVCGVCACIGIGIFVFLRFFKKNKELNIQKGYYATRRRRQMWFLIALCIIPLINFAIFWVYVNFKTIILTFYRYDKSTGEYIFINVQRYISVFKEYVLGTVPANQNVYLNSFRAIIINLIILPIAFIASYSFYKKIRFEKAFRVLFMFPSIISLVVLTMVYRYMFNNDFGPIATIIEKITGKRTEWLAVNDSKHLWTLIYIFAIWAGLGTNVIMISGAMLRIPSDITEACLIDGVGFWREAVQFVLPLIMPTIGIYFISILTSCLSFTMQPMLIATDNGPNNRYLTMSWYIYKTVNSATSTEDQMLQASTVGIVFSLLLMPFVVGARILANKITPDVDF